MSLDSLKEIASICGYLEEISPGANLELGEVPSSVWIMEGNST